MITPNGMYKSPWTPMFLKDLACCSAVYVTRYDEVNNVDECISFEVNTTKRFLRYFPAQESWEWGWSLHDSASQIADWCSFSDDD